MSLLCCTKKLLDKIPKRSTFVAAGNSSISEDDWYANFFRLGRCQAVIFTHSVSLYSFIADRVRKEHFKNIVLFFQYELEKRLKADGLSNGVVLLQEKVEDIQITKTRNRSVLGSMNDMVHCARYIFDDYPQDDKDALRAMMRGINDMPMKAIGYQYPRKKFCQCYGLDE